MLGILLIDKPLGVTSHDVVAMIRRKFNTKRVGHAGTLDPLATGLLVIAVGPATRFLQYLPLEPKEYECQIKFGEETNTQDREGEVTATKPVPEDLAEKIQALIPQFSGEIQQIPPMYSAVKRAGKPLYFYARQGEEVEREPRTVFIEALEFLGLEGDVAHVRVICSGGTYVRTLAHDMGQALGCGAHLHALQRTQVGRFAIEDAFEIDDATPEDLIPLREALFPMPEVILNEGQERLAREGQVVRPPRPIDGKFAMLIDTEGNVMSVAESKAGMLQPLCVIPRELVP